MYDSSESPIANRAFMAFEFAKQLQFSMLNDRVQMIPESVIATLAVNQADALIHELGKAK